MNKNEPLQYALPIIGAAEGACGKTNVPDIGINIEPLTVKLPVILADPFTSKALVPPDEAELIVK